jgi:protein-S-isoprenylcysteine O-methyltransferase Ste14
MALQFFFSKGKTSGYLGRPTLDPFSFYTGKLTLFIPMVLFIVKACYPGIGYLSFPPFIAWIAVCLLWAGTLILTIALVQLGKSVTVGLPMEINSLKTNGLYHLSRNPIYIAVFMMSIASVIYFPDLINATFVLYGIYQHHKIILEEEKFLSEQFGPEWENYRKTVHRYF